MARPPGQLVDHVRLIAAMQRQRIDVNKLATASGTTPKTIRAMMRPSGTRFAPSAIRDVAAALGLSAEDLVRYARQGRITAPESGARVRRALAVRGVSIDLAPTDHVWVSVAHDGLFWPKEPEAIANARFHIEILESGHGLDPFDLLLLSMPSEGHAQVLEWLERGRRDDHYPGFTAVCGAVVLARVEGLAPAWVPDEKPNGTTDAC
jgi:hypothetical protein